jgi:hypothetical protein
MRKSEHTYDLMKCVMKDDDWRVFTQLMYNKIDTLTDIQGEVIVKITAPETQLQKDHDSEVAGMLSMFQIKNQNQNSKHSWKYHKFRGISCESNGGSSESEMHRHRYTQECYRYHQVGCTSLYCTSTAPVESGALPEAVAAAVTDTAAVAAMTTTSIENYSLTVTTRESPAKASWYFHCATTTHIC